jgi:hypothetical protein
MAGFELFLTVDQGFEYQQNLTSRRIAIIILCAKSNRLNDLLALVPSFLSQAEVVQRGQIVRISS